MIWPFARKEPEPSAEAVEERSETVRAREAKKSAVSSLMDALKNIEIERDISDAITPREKERRP